MRIDCNAAASVAHASSANRTASSSGQPDAGGGGGALTYYGRWLAQISAESRAPVSAKHAEHSWCVESVPAPPYRLKATGAGNQSALQATLKRKPRSSTA